MAFLFNLACCLAILYKGYTEWMESETDHYLSELICWESFVIAFSPLLYYPIAQYIASIDLLYYKVWTIIIVMLLILYPVVRLLRRIGGEAALWIFAIPFYLYSWSYPIENLVFDNLTVKINSIQEANTNLNKRWIVHKIELDLENSVSYITRSDFKRGNVSEELFIPVVGSDTIWFHYSFSDDRSGYSSTKPKAEENRVKWERFITYDSVLYDEVIIKDDIMMPHYLQTHNRIYEEIIEGNGLELAKSVKSPNVFSIERYYHGGNYFLIFGVLSFFMLGYLFLILMLAIWMESKYF